MRLAPGLAAAQRRGIAVIQDRIIVGEWAVDLLVEDALIVELMPSNQWSISIAPKA